MTMTTEPEGRPQWACHPWDLDVPRTAQRVRRPRWSATAHRGDVDVNLPKRDDRIRLVHTTDEWTRLPVGMLGYVNYVDQFGTVHVWWDDGSRLGLVYEAGDRWEIIPGH